VVGLRVSEREAGHGRAEVGETGSGSGPEAVSGEEKVGVVGRLKASARAPALCAECGGVRRHPPAGGWYHRRGCRRTAVEWEKDGPMRVWPCPWGCTPIRLASGRTHPHTCPFWQETEEVPF
jgi:hypothetical protein